MQNESPSTLSDPRPQTPRAEAATRAAHQPQEGRGGDRPLASSRGNQHGLRGDSSHVCLLGRACVSQDIFTARPQDAASRPGGHVCTIPSGSRLWGGRSRRHGAAGVRTGRHGAALCELVQAELQLAGVLQQQQRLHAMQAEHVRGGHAAGLQASQQLFTGGLEDQVRAPGATYAKAGQDRLATRLILTRVNGREASTS